MRMVTGVLLILASAAFLLPTASYPPSTGMLLCGITGVVFLVAGIVQMAKGMAQEADDSGPPDIPTSSGT